MQIRPGQLGYWQVTHIFTFTGSFPAISSFLSVRNDLVKERNVQMGKLTLAKRLTRPPNKSLQSDVELVLPLTKANHHLINQ